MSQGARQGQHARTLAEVDRRARAWAEVQKINAWMPNVYRQRAAVAAKLQELDEFIAQEEAAKVKLRAITNGNEKEAPSDSPFTPPLEADSEGSTEALVRAL